jgi:hypothetical protein
MNRRVLMSDDTNDEYTDDGEDMPEGEADDDGLDDPA